MLYKKIFRELYWFTKDSSLFAAPILRILRGKIQKKYLKSKNIIKCGSRVTIEALHQTEKSRFITGPNLKIGSDTLIDFSGSIEIGENVSISEHVTIFTHDHNIDGILDWQKNGIYTSNLKIENFVWLGANSIILPSVSFIGEGAVVAAGSVVTKDVPPLAVVAGNPAKWIRNRKIS